MLATLQSRLEQVYDLQLGYSVEHFVVTDPLLAAALGARPEHSPEQLLVYQEGDELSLSLFLDEQLLTARPDSLNAFTQLVEGVSHFVYLAHRAQHDRPVTQLELELQAEVDKFFTVAQHRGDDLDGVHRDLFEQVRFRDGLTDEERHRYRTANRLAARVCGRWLRQYGHRPEHPEWLAEARRFYRMSQTRKLRWS